MLERHVLHHNARFEFEAGGALDSIDISYYCSPRKYTPGEKVVWVCHALTGNADPCDWWDRLFGEGKFFDPSKCFVVCVSMLASAYADCNPRTINPATGKPWLLDFPRTTVRDTVKASILVRQHLGIESIDVLMGPSIGGFQAYEWAVMEPDRIKNAVFLATTCRVLPMITAYNESQRMALLADPSFEEAKDIHGGRKGLECARSIALISYRTTEGYNLTQPETDDDTLFADRAASYQRYQGHKLVTRDFDAYSYWYLTYTLDSMNIGRGRGGVEKALKSIKAKSTVICITTDMLFTSKDSLQTARMIPGCSYHEIASDFGHDGFFIESGKLEEILREELPA